jgi:hypothetical protein
MAQGPFGLVVSHGQPGLIEDDPEGIPVVEELAGERTGLVIAGLGVSSANMERGRQQGGMLVAERSDRRVPRPLA